MLTRSPTMAADAWCATAIHIRIMEKLEPRSQFVARGCATVSGKGPSASASRWCFCHPMLATRRA
jgi:hypothetical protein